MFTAVLLEAGVRIFHPMQESMEWFESSVEYGYTQKKKFKQSYKYINSKYDFTMEVSTNTYGHRYFEYDKHKLSRDSYRKVLLLGDSFVFGHGVNIQDHIAYHLDSMLNDVDTNFVVINAGFGGWGTLQQTKYAINHFDIFNPNIIVLFFCGNDPLDDIRFKNNMSNNEKGVLYFPGKVFLRNNSHLYRFLITKFKTLIHQFVLNAKIKEKNAIFNRQSSNIISDKDWERTLGSIHEFQKKFIEFNSEGILFVAATSPWKSNIRKKLLTLNNDKNIYYLDLFNETINLTDDQRRLPYDGHWSKIIHKKFAKTINDKIKENLSKGIKQKNK